MAEHRPPARRDRLPGTEGKERRLFVQRFVKTQYNDETHADSGDRAHFEYLFKMTLDKKTIIFTNSREETEFVISNLREIALKNKAPDVYRVHHGNVSALLREQTEDEMKTSEEKIVTGATVTLELGIDIGSLDQAYKSPPIMYRVSPATGLRSGSTELLFTFVEDLSDCRRHPRSITGFVRLCHH
jgi:ATP-dependent Lhr-like helicase